VLCIPKEQQDPKNMKKQQDPKILERLNSEYTADIAGA
jgi:hypothetical protein